MPANDLCHDKVVRALAKEGWVIENSPLKIAVRPRTIFIDLELRRGSNGERQQMLLIEVKCFPDRDSTTRDLYIAIGQYLIYRAMLAHSGNPTSLYLSIPQDVYETLFDVPVTHVIAESSIKLVIIDLEKETVEQWIE